MQPTAEFKESFDDRVKRERAECHAQYLDLYNGIAVHLTGWAVTIDNPDDDFRFEYRYRLVSGIDNRAIHLGLGSGQYRGMVHVSGYWPRRPNYSFTSPSDVHETVPSINCSLSRGYEVIAKDIRKRFLPEYQRIWDLLVAKIAAENDYATRKLANWNKLLAAKLVVNPRERNGEYTGDARVASKKDGTYNYDKGYGDIRMTGEDSIEIKLQSLPVDTAIRILKALRGE